MKSLLKTKPCFGEETEDVTMYDIAQRKVVRNLEKPVKLAGVIARCGDDDKSRTRLLNVKRSLEGLEWIKGLQESAHITKNRSYFGFAPV